MLISVSTTGELKFVYNDELFAELKNEGTTEIKRASNVEPSNSQAGVWEADLGQVLGPVLGPFETRKAALAAEVRWLNRNLIGGLKCQKA